MERIKLLDKEDFQSMSLIDQQRYLADIISLLPTEEQRYFVDVIMDMISNEEYKSFILQGTNSSESVKARLDYWRGVIRKLDWQK